ncbi:2-oxoacid dehydrogenases acyltransferase-domain-containing protein [Leptodontidium sp. 2 PMI_412]|nr:2-oxoacid dehydrogenases acyltransferase-domain-containing protein [Leptodontidium sp. 2 PMI_412]
MVYREVLRLSSPTVGRLSECRKLLFSIGSGHYRSRSFHSSQRMPATIPFLLADIGEGITECQIMKWSVKPGDRIEQFDDICELQSDKASVDITSRFDGVIGTLHYEQNDMAIVGKPLVDIEVDDEALEESDIPAALTEEPGAPENLSTAEMHLKEDIQWTAETTNSRTSKVIEAAEPPAENTALTAPTPTTKSFPKNFGIAMPAVRHMTNRLKLSLAEIPGTGKDALTSPVSTSYDSTPTSTAENATAEDRHISLNAIESQMFKVMTQSLDIPHFLFTNQVDFTSINLFRSKFESDPSLRCLFATSSGDASRKITTLPFLMKALSYAFLQAPKLNSHLDTESGPQKPRLILKARHNFGVAIDTPQGLLVPVVHDVQSKSVMEIAADLTYLSRLARAGRPQPKHFKDATFIVSNIGSVGGSVVSPVIVRPMVGIVAMGQIKGVPAFREDSDGKEELIKLKQAHLSWSADHRVVDGATVVRCVEQVRVFLENF